MDDLVDRLEAIFGASKLTNDKDDFSIAYRWRSTKTQGYLEPLTHIHTIRVEDLSSIDHQIKIVDTNTRQFLNKLPRNNVLLWGARGTGKSSLVKAMLNRYSKEGLRLIEIDAHDLIDLPQVVDPLIKREERFILYVDDLSFDEDDASYRTLKAALDGSVAVAPENVVIYATSNRRHLVPEQMADNLNTRVVGGEIHHSEAVEEKISLSERFGVWLSFYPFSQDQYLTAVAHWLKIYGIDFVKSDCQQEAINWARLRGNRSGRIAAQFALDYSGRMSLMSLKSQRKNNNL